MPTFSTVVEVIQQVASTVTQSASAMAKALMHSTLMQNYVRPMCQWLIAKYDSSPVYIKLSLWALLATSAIPLACFLGFMTAATFGCLIVGALTFGVVEGGVGVFASAFLLPTLGLMLLLASGVGATVLALSLTFRASMFFTSLVFGQATRIQQERRAGRLEGKAHEKLSI